MKIFFWPHCICIHYDKFIISLHSLQCIYIYIYLCVCVCLYIYNIYIYIYINVQDINMGNKFYLKSTITGSPNSNSLRSFSMLDKIFFPVFSNIKVYILQSIGSVTSHNKRAHLDLNFPKTSSKLRFLKRREQIWFKLV